MPKTFDIGNGYSLQFDQRAKGEETPYYLGLVLKDKEVVGYFNNNGRGGATIIHPPLVKDHFIQMFNKSAKKQGLDHSKGFEVEAEIINFVNVAGYKRSLKEPLMSYWDEWVAQAFEEL